YFFLLQCFYFLNDYRSVPFPYCVFPAISPLDCLEFPLECPAGQRCLSSEASGHQGPIYLTIYEKSCANPSQCGRSGQKYSAGVVFNYTNDCCDTDLFPTPNSTFSSALSWLSFLHMTI
uniref:Uncharacterized protein n=1 Tax=Oryzias latipes TaxID=8090 RepID=H2L9W5_ORYLA